MSVAPFVPRVVNLNEVEVSHAGYRTARFTYEELRMIAAMCRAEGMKPPKALCHAMAELEASK